MAIFKAAVEVRDPGERVLGEGMAYVHLPRDIEVRQDASGTVSLKRWEPGADAPSHLALADGRYLPISVSVQKLSDCSRNHILRFQADWPPSRYTSPRRRPRMAISREQVEHVAQLARLGLSEDEIGRLQEQLSQILESMRAIDRLDTSAIAPTAQVIPLHTVMRDDVDRPSLPVEDVLRNAPRREGDFFKVPPVLE